jgi:hypothetical protein
MSQEHDHTHHSHDHGTHPPVQPDDTSTPGHYELMILAMQDLLVEKGVLSADQIRRGIEAISAVSKDPELAAKVRAQGINPQDLGLENFDAHIRTAMTSLAPLLTSISDKR